VRAFGALVGVICHEHVGPTRRWTDEEQSFAAAIGDLVALAVMSARREQAEQLAAASAAQYRYLVESLPVAVYSLHPAAPQLNYLSPLVEALTGASADEWLSMGGLEAMLERAYPDDRASVHAR